MPLHHYTPVSDDDDLNDDFCSTFEEMEVRRLSLRDIVIDAERLPEIKQFARLLNDIRARILDDRTDSLLERLAVLG
jgi:hypothetical protein